MEILLADNIPLPYMVSTLVHEAMHYLLSVPNGRRGGRRLHRRRARLRAAG